MAELKSKAAIQNSAEKLFAKNGYEGTSLRQIADKANVAQALINYHFKTKERLYESIISRRAIAVNRVRRRTLKKCFEEAPNGVPSLEKILESFIRPSLENGRHRWGPHFSRILASLTNNDDKRSRELVEKNFSSISKEYLRALRLVLPDLPSSELLWGYLFATSFVFSSTARTGRIQNLSEGKLDDKNLDHLVFRTVRFIASGLKGMSTLTDDELNSRIE